MQRKKYFCPKVCNSQDTTWREGTVRQIRNVVERRESKRETGRNKMRKSWVGEKEKGKEREGERNL